MTSAATELIDFLDQHWCRVMTACAERNPLGPTPEESLDALQKLRQEFLQKLHHMSLEQLTERVIKVADEQDRERPFNRLGTDADYEHFGRCAYL